MLLPYNTPCFLLGALYHKPKLSLNLYIAIRWNLKIAQKHHMKAILDVYDYKALIIVGTGVSENIPILIMMIHTRIRII